MKFESRFDIGQQVWFIGAFNWPNRYLMVGGPATIGQIRIEHTDSPGREKEEVFDNYMPQKKHVESYMFVETGIGSGACYPVEHVFATKEEAKEAVDKFNAGKKA